MERLSPPERAAAQEALLWLSATCLETPIERALKRHTYVVAVHERPQCPRFPRYDVAIDVHTFLGWPMMQVVSECGGSIWCN